MSINIENGRRTLVAKPEWFPRPDGTERAVIFQPGYSSDRTGNPRTDYGKHGMEIRWLLRGPNGVTQFAIGAGWVPGEKGISPRVASCYPMGVDLGYHDYQPHYEDQPSMECDLLEGGMCFYDSSGLNADRVMEQFIIHGEPVVWAELEEYYRDLLGKAGDQS
jgi:hypothetical protein